VLGPAHDVPAPEPAPRLGPTEYWKPSHPSQIAYRAAIAAVFDTPSANLRTAVDGCGVGDVRVPAARGRTRLAMLADPAAIPAADPRAALPRR